MTGKKLIALFVCFISLAAVSAQQITRFAVIDTSRIYTTFYRDSRNARDYEQKSTLYKAEIKRMTEEIKSLRQKKVDAGVANDMARVSQLESEINTKTNFLVEYSKAKNAELDTLNSKLKTDDEFYSTMYEVIKQIGQESGYSMVLSLQDSASIIWYNPTVDITEDVIKKMTSGQ